MPEDRRQYDLQFSMVIDKIDNLENKMDLFVADFKHQCEQKHLALDDYIRKASDKVPIGTCNDRMSTTERVQSRHTVYWGIFICCIPFICGLIAWFIKIHLR